MSDTVDHSAVQNFYADRVVDLAKPCCGDTANGLPPKDAKSEHLQNVCDLGEGALTKRVKQAMALVHPDIIKKSFGCGSPFPPEVTNCRVLDLGSGTGRDCFVMGKLVGPDGSVVGVDMTPEMLKISSGHIPYHSEKFGYTNVEFLKGNLDKLVESTGLQPGTFDIIMSNCVVNLTTDKRAVLSDVYKLLKPGGEMYYSDVFAEHEVPAAAKAHSDAWNEGYGGALTLKNFNAMIKDIGFLGPFITRSVTYHIDKQFQEMLAGCSYLSNTVRLIKPSDADSPAGKYRYTGVDMLNFTKDDKFQPGESRELSGDILNGIMKSRYSQFFTRE